MNTRIDQISTLWLTAAGFSLSETGAKNEEKGSAGLKLEVSELLKYVQMVVSRNKYSCMCAWVSIHTCIS